MKFALADQCDQLFGGVAAVFAHVAAEHTLELPARVGRANDGDVATMLVGERAVEMGMGPQSEFTFG